MTNSVTVILNGYKRNHTLQEQIDALRRQSHRVSSVMYWQNTAQGQNYNLSPLTQSGADLAISSKNYGVWARFAYALNARTDFICVIDDDTIPGDRWIENCLSTHQACPGLLGTIGLVFKTGEYSPLKRYGWETKNLQKEFTPTEEAIERSKVQRVDIVGHNWFFHRDLLSVFWRELPEVSETFLVGEDIHFSYMIQKYTNLGTWVPPHPIDDRSLWGSLHAVKYGADGNATANFAVPMMNQYLKKSIRNGFKLISEI